MANFYTDNPVLRHYLTHPMMQRIVELKERNFADADKYDYAPQDFEDAIDSYDKVLEVVGGICGDIIAENAEDVDHQGPRVENSRVIYDGGQFLFPLDYYSRVTSEYGWREHPIFKTQKFHSGIDFGAPSGQPIKAAYRGEVVIAEYSSSAGNYIMLNHGNGLATVYMHCSKLNVSVGQIVEKGDIIGLVGSTGNSTGPHLHFSVRQNGEYVDPGPYIGM